MSSSLKPRSTGSTPTIRNNREAAMAPRFHNNNDNNNINSNNTNDDDDNEKEAKFQRFSAERFRHWIVFSLLLAAAAFVSGHAALSLQHSDVRPELSNKPPTTVAVPQEAKAEASAKASANTNTNTNTKTNKDGILLTLEQLQRRVDDLDLKVRAHKTKPGVLMERDPTGLKLTKELQHATHTLLVARYGRGPFRVQVDVILPKTIPDYSAEDVAHGQVVMIELGPIDLIPCSVYNFLEIARTWQPTGGKIHRNAHHVLQVQSASDVRKSMPFQEYSPEYPHRKGTTGYAGRPSGPGWYISIQDNTQTHGPGSQQKHNPYEADSLFGRVIQGFDDVVPRIHSVPQTGWLDKENQIPIPKMTILIQKPPKSKDQPHEWIPWTPP
jgi:hypothetical protein